MANKMDFTSAKTNLNGATRDVKDLENLAKKLDAKNSKNVQVISSQKEEIKRLKQEVKKLEKELGTSGQFSDAQDRENVLQLKEEIDSLRVELGLRDDQYFWLNKAYNNSKNQVASLNNNEVEQLKKLRKEVDQFRAENDLINDQYFWLNKAYKNSKVQIKELEAKLDEAETKFEEMSKVATASIENQKKIAEIANQSINMGQKEKKGKIVAIAFATVLGVATAGSTAHSIMVANENNQLKSENAQLSEELASAQEQINQYSQMLDETIRDLEVSEADVAVENGKIISFTTEDKNYEINLSTDGKEWFKDVQEDAYLNLDYFASIKDGFNFIKGYSEVFIPAQIEDLESEIEKLEDLLADTEYSELKELNEQLQTQIATLSQELEDAKKSAEETQNLLNQEIFVLQSEITTLSEDLQEAEDARNEAEKALESLQEEKNEIAEDLKNEQEENEKLQDTIEDLQQQLANAGGNNSEIQEKLDKALEENEKQQETIEDLESQLSDVNNALETAEKNYSDSQSALNELQSQFDELEKTLSEKEATIAQQSSKIAELEARIAELEEEVANISSKEEGPNNSSEKEDTKTPVADTNNPEQSQPGNNEDTNEQGNQMGSGR